MAEVGPYRQVSAQDPWDFLSSGVNASPRSLMVRGWDEAMVTPSRMTVPESTLSAPKMPRSSSVRPEPSMPAIPRISPFLRVNEISSNHGLPKGRDLQYGLVRNLQVRGPVRTSTSPNMSLRMSLGWRRPCPSCRYGFPSRSTVLVSAISHKLLQAVGDVDDDDVLLLELPDELEQYLGLVLGQCRGRFVQEYDLGPAAHGLDYLDHLALPHAQVDHQFAHGQVYAHLVQQGLRLGVGLFPVHERAAVSYRPIRMFSATDRPGIRLISW
jgi:hypothetical protein